MLWTETLDRVINHIEDHLTNDINNEDIEAIVCSSFYNFQRVFVFVFNMTVVEYIRYRRLSIAAIELINSETKIIDIALKYGYESNESFSRAFFQFHGILPSEAKQKDYDLKYCSKAEIEKNIKANIKIGKLKEITGHHILSNIKVKRTYEIELTRLYTNGVTGSFTATTNGLVITCAEDTSSLLTADEYQLPIKIDVIAKTDSTNLKLIYGYGDVTLNWKYSDWNYKINELMIHDVITKLCYGYPDRGKIECDTFTYISWIISKEFMALIINNELRYYNENLPYIVQLLKKPEVFSAKVGIASAWGSTIVLKHLCINELY